MARSHDERFEEDVRNVASKLFPGAALADGRYALGRERDGLFNDGDAFHIFEATTSRKKEKVEDDIAKSAALVAELRRSNPGYNVKIWIVTAEPPTVDQEQAAVAGRKKARCPVEVISFNTLYNRLFDARTFLKQREDYAFGSIRSPSDNRQGVPRSDYIKVGFFERATSRAQSPDDIVRAMERGAHRAILLGDFGAGKSMALRYLYDVLAQKFLTGQSRRFPVYLNLRDHFGQADPTEALIRHARRVGVDNYNRLVAAWRAGFADVILDGFDELSPAQFSASARGLRLARRAAAELVSNFVEQSPTESSLLISGRRHYFDSSDEMLIAIGADRTWNMLDLGEFSDAQMAEYLQRKGKTSEVPSWLPRRPLLIGYLAAWGMLDEAVELVDVSPVDGWDYLLSTVCEREVRQIPGAPVEASNLRRLLEKIATFARGFEGGRGPIPVERISATYEEAFGQVPDARTQTLLLRLPGLATVPGQENAREFLDDDFADACRVGDALAYLAHPFVEVSGFQSAEIEAGAITLEALSRMASGMSPKQVSIAIEQASSSSFGIIAVDLIKASLHARQPYTGSGVTVADSYVTDLEVFSDTDCSKVDFADCWFEHVSIYPDGDVIDASRLPTFRNCHIESISGIQGEGELPQSRFLQGTTIDRFTGFGQSNAEILTSDDMPLSVAVLLTILKKTFFQAGGGRQEAALYRGLDHRAKAYVPGVVELMQRHGFIEASKRAGPTLWIGVKAKLAEARAIRDAPMTSKAPLIVAVRALGI